MDYEEILDYKEEAMQMLDEAVDYAIDKDKEEIKTILKSVMVNLKGVEPLEDTYLGAKVILEQLEGKIDWEQIRNSLLEEISDLNASCEEAEEEQSKQWKAEKEQENHDYYRDCM